jgi:hypothetical protein
MVGDVIEMYDRGFVLVEAVEASGFEYWGRNEGKGAMNMDEYISKVEFRDAVQELSGEVEAELADLPRTPESVVTKVAIGNTIRVLELLSDKLAVG